MQETWQPVAYTYAEFTISVDGEFEESVSNFVLTVNIISLNLHLHYNYLLYSVLFGQIEKKQQQRRDTISGIHDTTILSFSEHFKRLFEVTQS